MHTGTGQLVRALCTHKRRLFLSFGGPVFADRISNCPWDRVLTYKNLIYLLNLQIAAMQGAETSIPYSVVPIFWREAQIQDHMKWESNDCLLALIMGPGIENIKEGFLSLEFRALWQLTHFLLYNFV